MTDQTTQTGRIVSVLADGEWHTTSEIHRVAGYSRLNSRISDLRKRGLDIVCEHHRPGVGPRSYRYRWLNAPPLPPAVAAPLTLDGDDVAPRTPAERYRVYRVPRYGGNLDLVATTPTAEGVGVTLVTLGAEGMFKDHTVGVLDTHGTDERSGTWCVNPWDGRP